MKWLWLVIATWLVGCGNYTASTSRAREDFYSGKYAEAAESLKEGAREEGVNQLLFVLDRATALHHAGNYEESNTEFHLADKLSEIKDYTSISTEAATLVTNDKITQYKGEDFERVLISQYLALNYLMLEKMEDVLVECRRVNHKLHMMNSQGKKKYRLNPMALYLTAMLYEQQKEWDHAYVDYQEVFKLSSGLPYLREDLYRLAWRNRIIESGTERWEKAFNLTKEEIQHIRSTANWPEIILIIENGRAPEKKPHPNWRAIPKFHPRANQADHVEVSVNDEGKGRSEILFDVETTAITDLDEKYAGLLAKRLAGVAAKETIAWQVGKQTDSPLLGAITRLGLHAMDQADLRSWLTLPKDFQIFRLRVPKAGTYKITLQPVNRELITQVDKVRYLLIRLP